MITQAQREAALAYVEKAYLSQHRDDIELAHRTWVESETGGLWVPALLWVPPQELPNEDAGLTGDELGDKYGPHDHHKYPREEWRYGVAEGALEMGYWDWVAAQLEEDDE